MAAKRIITVMAGASLWIVPAIAQSPSPPPGAASCGGCHPANPSAATPVPRLEGRGATELVSLMQGFRSGQQAATVMDRIAKGYSEPEIQSIADWYARQR